MQIAISAANTISEAATLHRSGNFQYTVNRRGGVFDTTVYNDFVLVVNQSGTGAFAGGYASSGIFTWVHNNVCNLFYDSIPGTADEAMNNYNWDIANNGQCSAYSPGGFY